MTPIVSPKLLSQVMMHGHAAELSIASYVKLYADLDAAPVAICKPTLLVLGSVPQRRSRATARPSNKTSYTSLPNSTFIFNSEGTYSEASLTSEEGSLISASETTSFSMIDLEDEGSKQSDQVTSGSTNSLDVYPGIGTTETCGSSVPSIIPSTCSIASVGEPPSTAATSIPPWECSKGLKDPLQKFGAPPPTVYTRSHALVNSLEIIRYRRASEATGANLSKTFFPRVRKYSDVRGLKSLGLRGLEILKKVKW